MKIICTKEEFAAMLETCFDRVKGDTCKACPLYTACGGEKGIVNSCVVSNGETLRCYSFPKNKPERSRLIFDDKE